MRSDGSDRSAPASVRAERFALALACILALCMASRAQSVAPGASVPAIRSAQPAQQAASSPPGPGSDSIIRPDDVLDLYILDVPELSRQYRVSEAGTVQLALLDQPIKAANLQAVDFANAVAEQLREHGLVSHPQVTVSIVSSRLQAVSITGAVKVPQIYPVFGRTSLLDLLSQAQGLADDAGNIAVISRGRTGAEADEGRQSETVDLSKLLQSADPAYNLDLYPGDRVTVPRAGIIYVVGAVNKPGGYPIRQPSAGMTVLQALAFAEDTKATAKRDKAMVIHPDPNAPGGHRQEPLNLMDILAGKASDPVLEANDILFVPDSRGKKAMARGLEAALGTATALAVYRP